MVPLNLPPYEHTLKREGDKVFILDMLRKKYLLLTPEEWVRQHFVHYLINDQGYPKALMKIEGGLKFNSLAKRSDIVVFTRTGNPWMLVECKAPDQKLRQATIEQAATYNHTLRAPFIVITNGMSHICCEVDWTTGTTKQLRSLPAFGQHGV
ncbi:MAG TPA: type I restriction enzyme HsdR N-terminal domain-containing protein [Chryseolinea sp.]|nr:type I restriction enzyme HsdR N-terminal domain-containing protein [Chryseolinea sp.]